MIEEEIYRHFARVSRLNKKDNINIEKLQELKEFDGVKKFKKKILGLLGTETSKNLDDIAKTLYEVGIVYSLKEGKDLVPHIAKIKILRYSKLSALCFKEVNDHSGEKKYEISSVWYNPNWK